MFARYLIQRIGQVIPVLLGISAISFLLMHLTPGDPAEIMLRADGIQPTQEAIAMTRITLGLDRSIPEQYLSWLVQLLQLDLGISYSSGRPVMSELMMRFPATALLAGGALAAAMLIALPLGIGSALYPGSWLDRLGRLIAMASASMPGYWLGLLLLYYGAVKLKLFPVMGMEGARSIVLPALTLGCGMAGIYIRLIRANLLEELGKLYVTAARAKGLPEWQIISSHALRNAVLPSLTLLGIQTASLLGGSVIIESIFSWPGIGKYAVDAIFAKDYIVIQGYVFMMAVIVVMVNLIVDLIQLLLDPRLRLR
ncbi:nickel ABC transporter permease [Paenibacillus daejeonensis]|uniref:nickel ABC transporter permease n=1 Tax=Paenibacillus daejeonensis TaxID=135193 RepID=UPI00035E9DDA|nr:nickel ABC transporter permease [Paenibacillus daejeonensis]